MLHFTPESLESAKQRIRAALAKLYDARNMPQDEEHRASNQRRHVFDFADGIRFIVTRESYPIDPRKVVAVMDQEIITQRDREDVAQPKTVVHLSASFDQEYWLFKRYKDRIAKGWTAQRVLADFVERVRGRAGELFSLPKDSAAFAEPTYVTPVGLIPHWLILEEHFAHLLESAERTAS